MADCVEIFGILSVYRRDALEGLPKYFVMNDAYGLSVKEFSRKDRALKWARENQEKEAQPRTAAQLKELLTRPGFEELC